MRIKTFDEQAYLTLLKRQITSVMRAEVVGVLKREAVKLFADPADVFGLVLDVKIVVLWSGDYLTLDITMQPRGVDAASRVTAYDAQDRGTAPHRPLPVPIFVDLRKPRLVPNSLEIGRQNPVEKRIRLPQGWVHPGLKKIGFSEALQKEIESTLTGGFAGIGWNIVMSEVRR
jgi:hypothetical protein